MKIRHLTIVLPLAALLLASCTGGNSSSFRYAAKDEPLSNHEIAKLVDELYEKMTQEERIAQLHGVYLHDLQDENGHLDPEGSCRLLCLRRNSVTIARRAGRYFQAITS